MAKPTIIFKCTNCGHTQAKWGGQCPKCQQWSTLEETENITLPTSNTTKGVRAAKIATGKKAQPINKIAKETGKIERIDTHIGEVNRVLGGGLVPGGVILLAGEPGIGKSSAALAIASSIANAGKKVLYITGEETEGQVASRAIRIGATDSETALGENLYLLAEGNLQNAVQELVDLSPDFFIVDSIQTLISNDSESRVGSITQVTEVVTDFTHIAKRLNIPTILIGHITKSGDIAGPKTAEHLVDCVLTFEASEDSPLRLLRAKKNRYGSVDEIGCFEHTSAGLMPVEDPSGYFTSPHEPGTTGFATSITLEGIRALPIELTALVTKTKLPNPRKITSGIDHARALQMQAVLDRYIHMNLDSQDVYIATTGGLRLKDSSTDLAVIAALVSSTFDIPIPTESVFIGEVSLTGEIRPSRERNKRCLEAARLGFTTIYTTPGKTPLNVEAKVVEVSSVAGLVKALTGKE